MPAPTTLADVFDVIRRSKLLGDEELNPYLSGEENPESVVRRLQSDGLLTPFQAEQILKGRHKGFVLGKYRLLDRIGMGGMGQVYLAEHTSMKRRVALKVLPPDRGKNHFSRERFLREARAAAALEHPNLVRAYDVEMEGDVAYLIMEYIDGVTLHDLVVRRGPVEPGRVAHFLWQIANGLQAVHYHSLVHRDIKPANLLLDRAGIVRILDLGLVRSELDDGALTRGEGATIVGTADYLAPEQAMDCSKVDARADLYSLGCTAYYLLAGQPPFVAEKVSQKLVSHQALTPQPIQEHNSKVPDGLAEIVHKMLAKKPEDRQQSAAALMDELAPYVQASIPTADDFPTVSTPGTKAGISLNGWVSMNMVPKTTAGTGSIGGSAIRYTSDTNPKLPSAQAQQQTTANSAQETLPAGIPTKIPPLPVETKTIDLKAAAAAKVAKKASPVPPTILVPAKKPRVEVPQPTPNNSTTVKANALFRTAAAPPMEDNNDTPPTSQMFVYALGGLIAISAAIILVIIGVRM